MTSGNTIRRADLLRIMEADNSVDPALPIIEQVRALDAEDLPVKAIPTHELQAIYERRRTRMPDTHPLSASVNRLLAALADYRGAVVIAVTLESSSMVAAVWLSAAGNSVISTLVQTRDVQ